VSSQPSSQRNESMAVPRFTTSSWPKASTRSRHEVSFMRSGRSLAINSGSLEGSLKPPLKPSSW